MPPLQLRCDPAAQLDLPLIEQAAQPLHRRLLSPGEAILLAQQQSISAWVITPEPRLSRNSSPVVIDL